MADREYGIVLSARDNASAAVKALSGAMGATTKAVQKMGSVGASVFSAIGGAVVVANNAVQLFKSGFEAISSFVGGSLDAVRELRGETNPLVVEMDRLATNSLAVKAALGTAFASALLGISKAFSSVGGGAADFLDKNRKLIATKIVQYLFRLAQALTTGIAKALTVANDVWAEYNTLSDRALLAITGLVKAFFTLKKWMAFGNEENAKWALGLKLVAEQEEKVEERIFAVVDAHAKYQDEIDGVIAKIQELMDKGYGPAMAASIAFAEAAGKTIPESTAQALMRIGIQANSMRFALADAAEMLTSGLGMAEGTLVLDRFQTKLDAVNQLIGVATTTSVGALKSDIEGLYASLGQTLVIDVDLQNLDQSKEAFALFTAQLDIALKKGREGFNALNAELDITAAGIAEAEAAAAAMIGAVSSAVVGALISLAEGQKTMAEASLDALSAVMAAVVQVAMNSIIASSLTGQANAIAGNLGIPVWGLAIGIAAGLAALAAISALKSKLPEPKKFAQGGLVTGGMAGRDSVPAMLMPGEFVLTTKQTDSLRRGNSSLGGGGNITINMTSQIPPTKAEMKKHVRQNILPALELLKAQGMA